MSDAAENQNIDDIFEDGADINEPEESQEDQAAEVEVVEEKHQRGYMTKDEWTKAGKDPDKWVSQEVFEERGERIKLKTHYDNLLKNQSLLHQMQLKNQREELLRKRDDAIDIADKDAVKGYDKQLKELDQYEELAKIPEAQSQPGKPPEILEWEAENEWCQNPNDPRLKLANRVFNEAIAQGKTNATALRMVDREIEAKFSSKQSSPKQIAEGVRSAGGNRESAESVTMKTLTREEQKAWDSGLFSNQKDFLKLVESDRKAAKSRG